MQFSSLIYSREAAQRRKAPKNRRNYWISFLVPVAAMLLIFFFRGIFPFGEETFLRTDMYHQYAPFFSEFHYKLRHGGSLLYSWDVGLGINFSALYAYYLASPMNWLLFLCPKGLILEFMTYMIVVKIGLSGVSMCFYLCHRFPKRDLGCAVFAILYAMSGYISAYSWNIMWLDCIILFPLIMLGLEKLVRGESGMLYVLALGFSILSNYYISIMTCIFMVIYFLCLNVLEGMRSPRQVGLRILRFSVYSLIAGGLAAVTLLPEIYALQMTASSDFTFPQTATQYFTIIDMFARQMPFVETEQGLDHWPNIYAGSIVFLLLPMYFMNPRIPMRRKLVHGLLLIFFYLSFSVNILNFIWHGFHYPNSLPCRQSFLYIFLLLSMCYEAYLHRRAVSPKTLHAAFAMAAAFCLIAQKVVTDDAIHFSVFYLTMLFVLLCYGLFYAERQNPRAWKHVTAFGLLIVLSVEASLNMAVTSVTTTSRTAYTSDNADVEKLVRAVQAEDTDFYRFEKITRKTKDDGAWMNFPSVSLFSSTAYAHCSDFFRLMGMEASTNAYSITGSTPLMNMLMSVKYDIYSEEPSSPGERGLSFIGSSGNTSMYRTDFALPLGYVLPESTLDGWNTHAGTPALAQNSLCEALQCDPVLVSVLGEFYDVGYSFTATEAGEYYAYVSDASVKQVSASYGYTEKNFNNVDRGFLLELGYLEAGDTVTLRSKTEGQSLSADVYRFDYRALQQVKEKLSQETWELTTHTDTMLSGTVTTTGGVLMTSIPYDPGWSITVDGVKTEITEVKDTFIGVPLEPGTHTVEMHYMPQGLRPGALLSLLSLLLLLGLWYFTGRRGRTRAAAALPAGELSPEEMTRPVRDLLPEEMMRPKRDLLPSEAARPAKMRRDDDRTEEEV